MKQIRPIQQLLHFPISLKWLVVLTMLLGLNLPSAQANCVKGEFDVKVDGYNVTFKARTSGPVLFSYWYLDNTVIGKGDSLRFTFRDTGSYKVCLLLLGYDSVHNQKCEFKYCEIVKIEDSCHLRTEFGYKIDGNKVLFEGYSNSSSVKYFWKFGDGRTGAEGKVVRREFANGTYKVCVLVKDTVTGCMADYCKTITINNCELTAGFDFETDSLKTIFEGRSNSSHAVYYWNFGDGQEARGRIQRYTYDHYGRYEVCLTVVDTVTHCKKRICKIVELDSCNLEARFGFKLDSNRILVEGGSNSNHALYRWSFGDGHNGSGRIIKHTYLKPGRYELCLTVIDTITHCKQRICKIVEIDGCNLEAKFGFRVDSSEVLFEAGSNSHHAVYKWYFGDGHDGSGRLTRHKYARPGRYEVCLLVMDTVTRCHVKICRIVEIGGCELEAKFGFRVDSNQVLLEAGSNSRHVVYRWSFGDGHNGSGRLIKHRYAKPGKYEVCLYALDTVTKCHVKICKIILIGDDKCNLEAGFHFKIDGHKVLFEGRSYDRDVKYIWDFGDGHDGSGRILRHEFKRGTYKVCLTIVYADGKCRSTICKEITIDPCELEGDFTFKNYRNKFIFGARSNDDHAIYLWNFGDGSVGTGSRIRHEYHKAGVYTVCLTIISRKEECRIKICKRIEVKDRCDVEVDFRYADHNGEYKFEAKSNKNHVLYFWDFGDGTYGKGQYPKHTYRSSGRYKVCVTAFDLRTFCKVTTCKIIEVKVKCTLEANFRYELDSNGVVNFKATANQTNVRVFWDFGDGHYGRGLRTWNQYSKSGYYKVCMYVISSDGCKVRVCKEIGVRVKLRLLAEDKDHDDEDRYTSPTDNTNVTVKTNADLSWNVTLTPNPVSSGATVSVSGATGARVEVINMVGTVVRSETMNGNEIKLELGTIERGYYFIRVTSAANDVRQVKFLKQ